MSFKIPKVVYYNTILSLVLIALLSNFVVNNYYTFLGVFTQTNYSKLIIGSSIILIISFSTIRISNNLNKIRPFINKNHTLYNKHIGIFENIFLAILGLNSMLNAFIGFFIKKDLEITFSKIYLLTYTNDIFYAYIIINTLIAIIAYMLIRLSKK